MFHLAFWNVSYVALCSTFLLGFHIGLCCAACRVTHALQGDNKVGDQGAAALADSLKTNSCLTALDLVSEGSMVVDYVVVVICFMFLFINAFFLILILCFT